ncbi:MAG: PsbP-related protein [Candidatus Curtissbacteria bacterium]|nr:PsbP-related protein [Candidatus Curtissbacteria bacterium]
MNKSAHPDFSSRQKGFANLLVIGGVVILGIAVFLIASGTLKFSGYVKVDDKSKSQAGSQVSQSTAQPTEKPKSQIKLSAEPFVDSKLGFSISYPEGWKVNSATTNVTIYKSSDTKGSDKADALISVFSVPIGDYKDTKLATIADLHKVQLKKQFSDVKFLKEGEIKVGEENAYEMEFTGVLGGENMHGRYMVITSPKNLYAILGGVNEGMWSTYKDYVDASIATFKPQ